MSEEEWSEFLRFAELQRVYLRTLQLLEKWAAADASRRALTALRIWRKPSNGRSDDCARGFGQGRARARDDRAHSRS